MIPAADRELVLTTIDTDIFTDDGDNFVLEHNCIFFSDAWDDPSPILDLIGEIRILFAVAVQRAHRAAVSQRS